MHINHMKWYLQKDQNFTPSCLASLPNFWEHWGFTPWTQGTFSGVVRSQNFVKDGFLGKVAEYNAIDYIVWNAGSEQDRTRLWNSLKPIPEVMTQRFLFLLPSPWAKRKFRSFWWGFRGYTEFYAYWPSTEESHSKDPIDLTGLVHLGLELFAKRIE